MKAAVCSKYGGPEQLSIVGFEKPKPKDNEILIRIHATSVNSADIRLRKADPFLVRLMYGLLRPRFSILGITFSGTVEEIGNKVTRFKTGDEVFGLSEKEMGTYAEYKCIDVRAAIAIKPTNLSHDQAASIPFGAHTALHFLRKADIKPEQSILVYGASGAVGSATVQVAKQMGAKVTAVCSSKNIEMMRNLGADKVIDYTQQDIYLLNERFDVIVETVNKTQVSKIAKLLKPKGTLMLVAALIKGMLAGSLLSLIKGFKVIIGEAKVDFDDMEYIKKLVEDGSLRPTIDKTYKLDEIVEAHRYVEQGHKAGNVVVSI